MLISEAMAEGAPDNVTLSLIRNASSELDVPPGLGIDEIDDPTYRCCFDDKDYERNSRALPYVLMIIVLSVLFLILFI